FPSLNRVTLDGALPQQLATRYLGSTSAIGRDTIYFDQIEQRRNVGLYSDLYALSRTSGDVRELSTDARLRDPDLSPDGTTLVATRGRTGQRDLVLVRLKPDVTDNGRPNATDSRRPGATDDRRPDVSDGETPDAGRPVPETVAVVSGISRTAI